MSKRIRQQKNDKPALNSVSGGGSLVAELCATIATPCTIARQGPLSMGFPRKEYWNGMPFSSPGDLPNLRIEPGSPALQEDSCIAGGFFTD